MTSTIVLGIGVMATVKVYGTSTAGREKSKARADVTKVVEQRLDALEALGASNLPVCEGAKTCRNEAGGWTPRKPPSGAYPCTQIMGRPSLKERRRTAAKGKFRVDTMIWAHSDADQRSASRLIKVSACWKDRRGRIQQVAATRMVMDGDS